MHLTQRSQRRTPAAALVDRYRAAQATVACSRAKQSISHRLPDFRGVGFAGLSLTRAMALVAILVLLSALAPAQAIAQQAPLPGTAAPTCSIAGFPAPTLCARAGLDQVRARYIVLVDESRSMTGLWSTLKGALGTFCDAIADGDELEVYTFSSTAKLLVPGVPADQASRASCRTTASTLAPPMGTSTDLGRAAETALSGVRGAQAEKLLFVFFLTDGAHQPAPGSPYPTGWAASWQDLAAQARPMLGARPVSVAVLRLAADARDSMLTRVFPTATPVDVIGAAALGAWFRTTSLRVAVDKVRLLVQRELDQPLAQLGTGDRLQTRSDRPDDHMVQATPTRRIVSTVLVSPTIALQGGRSVGVPPEPWLLGSAPSGRSVRVVDLHRGWLVPPGSVHHKIDTTVVVSARLEPASELAAIGFEASPRPDSIRVQLLLAGGGPVSAPLYYGAILITAVVAVLLLRRGRQAAHQPYLTGRVIVRGEAAGSSGERVELFDGKRLREFRVTHQSGRDILVLEARNERGRTAIYAAPGQEPVTLGGRTLRDPQPVTSQVTITSTVDGSSVRYLPR
jgi:hypothetical protein